MEDILYINGGVDVLAKANYPMALAEVPVLSRPRGRPVLVLRRVALRSLHGAARARGGDLLDVSEVDWVTQSLPKEGGGMVDRRKDQRVEDLKEGLLKRYRESGIAPIVEEVLGNIVARVAFHYTEGQAYTVLGVEPGDPPELVDKVWRVKALFYHPDNQKTGNREAFERVAAAYAIIKAREEVI